MWFSSVFNLLINIMKKNEDSNFLLNEEGSYSITRSYESSQIISIMKNVINNTRDLIITDATACMGGDAVNFVKHFKFVNMIEKNPENFKLLIENCKTFCTTKNYKLINEDFLKVELDQDIIYIDPPFGGRDYRDKKSITLQINNKFLSEIIPALNAKYIFIKAPINVNIDFNYDDIYNIYNKAKNVSFKLIFIRRKYQ